MDVAVHFVKANGNGSPKFFKLKRITLPARGRMTFRTSFSLTVHTTRVPRPGDHAVDVLVNGQALRAGSFEVAAPRPRASPHETPSPAVMRRALDLHHIR